MNSNVRLKKKSYALRRMGVAIERAMHAGNERDKARAAKWAAAWGMLCGIKSAGMKLRRSDAVGAGTRVARGPADDIVIPAQQEQFPAAATRPQFASGDDAQDAPPTYLAAPGD